MRSRRGSRGTCIHQNIWLDQRYCAERASQGFLAALQFVVEARWTMKPPLNGGADVAGTVPLRAALLSALRYQVFLPVTRFALHPLSPALRRTASGRDSFPRESRWNSQPGRGSG